MSFIDLVNAKNISIISWRKLPQEFYQYCKKNSTWNSAQIIYESISKKKEEWLPAKRWKLQNFFCLLTFVSAEPFSLIGLVVTLFSGAPWAVTKCFRRYHLFFTTLSHSEQDTPCDWMCTLTICCFKLKELENVFQQ